LELLSVLETDDVVGEDRLLRVDRRLQRLRFGLGKATMGAGERLIHLIDQTGQIACGSRVVADIGGNNIRREVDEFVAGGFFYHGSPWWNYCRVRTERSSAPSPYCRQN